MSHNADAIVLACIDFRFQPAIKKFLDEELKLSSYDLKTDGGAVLQLLSEGEVKNWILKNFEISFELHNVNRIILINHTDCGAYGGSKKFGEDFNGEKEFHKSELTKAVSLLKDKYPDKLIEAYLAIFGEEITFEKIV